MPSTHDPNEVAVDAIAAGDPASVPTVAGIADGIVATVLQGSAVGKASAGLGAELLRIALGRSEVSPSRGDWRFKDPTWSTNPIYRRVAQTYLAACEAVDRVVEDVELNQPGRRAERARFVMNIVTSALSPTNTLLGNPAALKRTFETGGANLVTRGRALRRTTCGATAGCRRWPSRRAQGRRGPRPDAGVRSSTRTTTPSCCSTRPTTDEVYERARSSSCRRRSVATTSSTCGPGRSFVEYSRVPGTADVPDLLAQPLAGAVGLGHRHLRPADPRRRRRGPRGHRRGGRQRDRLLCRRHPATPRCSTSSRPSVTISDPLGVVRRHPA